MHATEDLPEVTTGVTNDGPGGRAGRHGEKVTGFAGEVAAHDVRAAAGNRMLIRRVYPVPRTDRLARASAVPRDASRPGLAGKTSASVRFDDARAAWNRTPRGNAREEFLRDR